MNQAMSVCRCGHTGDVRLDRVEGGIDTEAPTDSEHAGLLGHGTCTKCPPGHCLKFTWKAHREGVERPMNQEAMTFAMTTLRRRVDREGWDAYPGAAFVACVQHLVRYGGLTLGEAALHVKRLEPRIASEVMDRIGLYPSSEPEFAALQKVWP